MKLVAMVPKIYRFVGDHGEQLHSHGDKVIPSPADPRITWSWCNLLELFATVRMAELQYNFRNSFHLIRAFHMYKADGANGKRKHLDVAVVTPSSSKFVRVTQKELEELASIDPITIFVPTGWAQMVATELSKRVDPVRRRQLGDILVKALIGTTR
ncbi:hypothetical protein KW785_01010 [Candidatus Parcubacteria bacterium]|nr:hypothetical protein [Candidatus Parcubacteria bacterium]